MAPRAKSASPQKKYFLQNLQLLGFLKGNLQAGQNLADSLQIVSRFADNRFGVGESIFHKSVVGGQWPVVSWKPSLPHLVTSVATK